MNRTLLFAPPHINDGNYSFTGTLDSPLNLVAGTEYYLGITDDDNPYEKFGFEAETTTLGPASIAYTYAPSRGFSYPLPGYSFDFELLASPEPSTWAMLLGGLGLLAFWRVRSRKA
ncbi:MAG: PEP-CTERM sorting domain-containing protein [Methylacidiphilales bacterium]|nr:PEP-CTERM sorting domain-containing protein [Candidatus Methylacidiphilales bacterium]